MIRSLKTPEFEFGQTQTPETIIQQLLLEIATKTRSNDYHTKTAKEIGTILGRTLDKKEKKAWSNYRQNYIRTQKNQKRIDSTLMRKSEALRRRELLVFGLLGLDNENLCRKLISLQIARHEQIVDEYGNLVEKQGKASTDQVVRALALHTEAEISQIAQQILSFSAEQKKRAAEPIKTILDVNRAIRIIYRGQFFLYELNDEDLIEELVSIFETGAKGNWPKFLMQLLSLHLTKITQPDKIQKLKVRINSLPTSSKFTQTMKTDVVETIGAYLEKNKKTIT